MQPVRIFAALGNKTRYTILCEMHKNSIKTCCNRIGPGENGVSVSDVVRMTGLAQSTISQHLRVLEEAGLIRQERRSQCTCYFINSGVMKDVIVQVMSAF